MPYRPMNWKLLTWSHGACLLSLLCVSQLQAAIQIDSFGDYGWKSDDTRNASGVNLVGINNTHAGKPGQTPTAADDTAIANQIKFVAGPSGSTYGGAVSIDGTATASGKSNYSVISPTTGFADASGLPTSFSATYEMYKQHTSSGSTLAFKLGIQSTDWGFGLGESQNNFTAQRSGESVWDLVLVHVPSIAVVDNNTWQTINLDSDSGTWTLFRQAGNTFHPATPPNGQPGSDRTLVDWLADPTWGPKLFGPGAKVSSVQFGLGSSQPIAIGFVDYLQTNLLNGGEVIDFVEAGTAAVPELTSFVVWGALVFAVGGTTLCRRQRALT